MRARKLSNLILQVVVTGSTALSVGCGVTQGSCDGFNSSPTTRRVHPGSDASVSEPAGTTLSTSRCQEICSVAVLSCKVVADDGGTAVECTERTLCDGRRPAGLVRPSATGSTPIARFLAEVAHLEAASVIAIRVLAAELRRHRAPRALVRAARRAARDEVRHARVMRSMARHRGAVAEIPVAAEAHERSLEAIAIENAIEGCARETWGAVVAAFQGRNARDPAMRGALRRIARDESRHAALAWSVDAWVRPRLSPEARRRVDDARNSALDELVAQISRTSEDPSLIDVAGVPDGAIAHSLVTTLRDRLRRPS